MLKRDSLYQDWLQHGIFIAAFVILSLGIERTDFASFIFTYTAAFIAFSYLLKSELSLNKILILGILARAAFLFSTPELSDDVYRFLWDGRLWVQGENPFEHVPQYYLDSDKLEGLKELYPHLNSQQYFAIYPPVNQFIFGLAALLAPTGFFKAQLIIKLILFAGEIMLFQYGVKLLRAFNLKEQKIAWYFLNPLVISEIVGNLHFEGLMATFLLASFYYLKSNRWPVAAAFMALAICTKLLPIIYLPLFLPLLGLKKTIQFIGTSAIICVLLFLPFLELDLMLNMLSSVDLYFQSFQFNSFLYSILVDFTSDAHKKWVAFSLALIPAITVLWLAFKPGNLLQVLKRSVAIHTLYYFFSAVIHPWYLVTLIALNTSVNFRFIAIWSYLIGLTYFTYRTTPYEESSFIIALEYLMVFCLAFVDYLKKKNTLIETA